MRFDRLVTMMERRGDTTREAAAAAGYNVFSRHATGSETFNVFSLTAGDRNVPYGKDAEDKGVGFFFTTNRGMLSKFKHRDGRILDVFLWLHNPHIIDKTHPRYDLDNEYDSVYIYFDEIKKAGGPVAYRDKLISEGRDGIILGHCVTNYYQAGTYSIQVVFHPWQIKLADENTFDDSGNVIPSERRFDKSSDDIRESVKMDADSSRKPGCRI